MHLDQNHEKCSLSSVSTMPLSIARESDVADKTLDWQDQLTALLPRSGLMVYMMRLQTLEDMFGPELPALINAISTDKAGTQFVKEHGISAISR